VMVLYWVFSIAITVIRVVGAAIHLLIHTLPLNFELVLYIQTGMGDETANMLVYRTLYH
jgi:hypothetical protein